MKPVAVNKNGVLYSVPYASYSGVEHDEYQSIAV